MASVGSAIEKVHSAIESGQFCYTQSSYGQGKSGNFELVRENREGQGKVREFKNTAH